jgi:hypothetical protein
MRLLAVIATAGTWCLANAAEAAFGRKQGSSDTLTDATADTSLLNCEGHGVKDAEHMVFWEHVEADQNYVNPFSPKEEEFVTFEPDAGGWNNLRMAMETVVVLAAATGRTLVLPPKQGVYLLGRGRYAALRPPRPPNDHH